MMSGFPVIELDEIDSTNAYALKLLSEARPPEGTVISCFKQSQGRGTDTNQWESEPGKNLTLSLILYPTFLPVSEQFSLNQAITLALQEMVSKIVASINVTIKWPNDIYIGNKKVAGVLIQNSVMGSTFDFAVIGIGLNVNQREFLSDAPNPVSLSLITGNTYELSTIRDLLIESLNKYYQLLREGKKSDINKYYLEHLFRVGQWHNYLLKGIEVNARITGITNFGQLMLEGSDKSNWVCDLKEVKYLF